MPDFWSLLFNLALYIRMGLEETAARRFFSQPVSDYVLVYEDLAVVKMFQVTVGHPYSLQLLYSTQLNDIDICSADAPEEPGAR